MVVMSHFLLVWHTPRDKNLIKTLETINFNFTKHVTSKERVVARTLILGSDVYSYIHVLPDLLRDKFEFDLKRNSSGKYRIYTHSPPPPQLTF